ncbi:MAG: response regulator transcription factor [Betaproteobacteria bacterium]|jgi:RNA polymerase sigma factor (sigma-70 family)
MSSQLVFVVEDDEAVRDSIAMLLRLHGFEVVGFGSAEAFLQAGPHLRPAVALVDVRLPGLSGLELQRRLKATGADLPVVVITAFGDVAMARRALRDGAVDFLEKPVDESELVAAVAVAWRADRRRQDELREYEAMVARLQRLTDRETEVFERVTNGMHNREIAEEFGISQRTVEVHRARLMEKLQADRVADLFRLRFALDARRDSATGAVAPPSALTVR